MYSFGSIFIFSNICKYALASEASRPYNLDCIVHSWVSMTCTFAPPRNSSNYTIRYSYCYGCISLQTFECPNFANNTCTWKGKKLLRRDDNFSIFICDDKNNILARCDFNLKTIVRYSPVKNLNIILLSRDSVDISWNSGKEHFKYEVILRDGITKKVLRNSTSYESQIKYLSLRPKHKFEVSVRRGVEEAGFWSEEARIDFVTGVEDFTYGELSRLLGFQVLNDDGRRKEILLRWEVLRKYIGIKMFTIRVSSIKSNLTMIDTSVQDTTRSFGLVINSDGDSLFRVTLTCVTVSEKYSTSEIVIFFGDEISDFLKTPLLLISDLSMKFASLSWSARVDVESSMLFFDVNDYISPSDPLRENMLADKVIPAPITTNRSSHESPSMVDHRLHLSFQRMVAVGDEQVIVHGPMIPVTCGLYLHTDLAPPSNLTSVKDSSFNSLTLTWKSQVECGSRYFTHLVMEYYATDCEMCSEKAVVVIIPRLATSWTIEGLTEGPFQVRMKSVSNLTHHVESTYTRYVTMWVEGRRDVLRLVVPIALSSMILVIACAVVGSRTCSSMKTKVLIDVPTSTHPSNHTTTGTDKHPYHRSALKIDLERAKSFYRTVFHSQDGVFQSQSLSLDKQNSLAWWNPNYWMHQKQSFNSSSSPTLIAALVDDYYFEEGSACLGNLYIRDNKTRDEMSLYSSVKLLEVAVTESTNRHWARPRQISCLLT